jgi:hypothetical protein
MKALGAKTWAIPGGCMPLSSTGREPEHTSRDELFVLNASKRDAQLELHIYYGDRDPIGPYRLSVAAERMRCVRFNDLIDPQALPLAEPYACVLRSDEPVVVQFTRIDTSRVENAIATTMAFAVM